MGIPIVGTRVPRAWIAGAGHSGKSSDAPLFGPDQGAHLCVRFESGPVLWQTTTTLVAASRCLMCASVAHRLSQSCAMKSISVVPRLGDCKPLVCE
jgi:hypothetical protein